ncbi:MAG TPA: septal ring lytic transglycosylase RlpA family protein [Terriglobales bacterium]|nr:septal ring lytic transglycosylase RlpA family protein [Terriglobales bacterium]
MRRRFAEGLAVLLSVASLGAGAASGPSLEAAKVNKPWVTVTASKTSPQTTKKPKKSQPYQVGTASWYGEYFQGKQTASGEPYDMRDFTAAHPSLPLGTYVKVTNLKNGRAVVVRVNDRGPVVDGRIIDVSYNAARALGFKDRGLQRVRLDIYHPQTVADLQSVASLN